MVEGRVRWISDFRVIWGIQASLGGCILILSFFGGFSFLRKRTGFEYWSWHGAFGGGHLYRQ